MNFFSSPHILCYSKIGLRFRMITITNTPKDEEYTLFFFFAIVLRIFSIWCNVEVFFISYFSLKKKTENSNHVYRLKFKRFNIVNRHVIYYPRSKFDQRSGFVLKIWIGPDLDMDSISDLDILRKSKYPEGSDLDPDSKIMNLPKQDPNLNSDYKILDRSKSNLNI